MLRPRISQRGGRNSTNSFPNLRCLLQKIENKRLHNGEIGTVFLKQYCAVSDNKFEDDIAYVEGNNATEVGIDFLGSHTVSSIASYKDVFPVWFAVWIDRMELKLYVNYLNCQPRARNRRMLMLHGVMSNPSFVMKNSIMSQLWRLEEQSVQFENISGKLTDEMKAAVVLKCVNGLPKAHVNLSLNKPSCHHEMNKYCEQFSVLTSNFCRSLWFGALGDRQSAGSQSCWKGKRKEQRWKREVEGAEKQGPNRWQAEPVELYLINYVEHIFKRWKKWRSERQRQKQEQDQGCCDRLQLSQNWTHGQKLLAKSKSWKP